MLDNLLNLILGPSVLLQVTAEILALRLIPPISSAATVNPQHYTGRPS